MSTKIDFFNQVVIAKHNKPIGWHWHSLDAHEMPEDFVKVTGSVPTGVVSRGPRKGSMKWSAPSESVFIRMSEVRAAEREFEQQTGKCHCCQGEPPKAGKQPCVVCKGTGKPVELGHKEVR
jgi:hypothetical protein